MLLRIVNVPKMTEIFRHLRPKWYDRKTHEIIPQKFGGISFLLTPVSEKTYDFWIYMCPQSAMFSTKQAVKTLRDRVAEGIVPFGRIVIDDSPLMDQLAKFLIQEQMVLPSDAAKYALEIIITNSYAQKKHAQKEQQSSNTARAYVEEA